MTEQAVQKLRLSSPGDLVEAVPYLLGYHPSDSMVALALRGSRFAPQGRLHDATGSPAAR